MRKRIVRVPLLETERLYLRMWSRKDAADLFAYAKDPAVGPPAGWKPHTNLSESRMIIEELFRRSMTWAIVEKETGTVIGSIGLDEDKHRPGISSRELGYSMAQSRWGRGYMTEAAEQVILYAFEELKLEILSIRTQPDNSRSRRVIQKCGFHYDGTLRMENRDFNGVLRDACCFSLLQEEYRSRKREVSSGRS